MYIKNDLHISDSAERLTREELGNKFPEVRLWKAVVINAINDATSKSSAKYCKINKIKARNWLLQDNYYYNSVCELAGFSSNDLRKKIIGLIQKKDEMVDSINKI